MKILLLLLEGVGPAHLAGRRGVGHDVLALGEGGPELVEEGVITVVEIAEDGLDGLSGLVGIVEGDAASEFVLACFPTKKSAEGNRVSYEKRWCTTWVSMMPWKR